MTWNVHKYLQNRRFLRHGNINFRKLARRWFPPAVWLLDVWSNIKQHLNEPVRENGKRMNPFIEVFQKGRSMHCFCLRLDGLNVYHLLCLCQFVCWVLLCSSVSLSRPFVFFLLWTLHFDLYFAFGLYIFLPFLFNLLYFAFHRFWMIHFFFFFFV